jgi:hypothetical protein
MTAEVGKLWNNSFDLMDVIQETKPISLSKNTFSNLNFYEFVTNQYATLGGTNFMSFARIPFMRKLNWRENYWCKGLNNFNKKTRAINALSLVYNAPEKCIGSIAQN